MKKVEPKVVFYIGMVIGMLVWLYSIWITKGQWFNETLYAANIGFPEFSDFMDILQ